jgi:hypothetical protein
MEYNHVTFRTTPIGIFSNQLGLGLGPLFRSLERLRPPHRVLRCQDHDLRWCACSGPFRLLSAQDRDPLF